jgi:CrcB protein
MREVDSLGLLTQIGLVALGSACGGLLRWSVGVGLGRLLGTALPYGTFTVNITGSLFLGWFTTLLMERWELPDYGWITADNLRLLLAVGFTGAYTTFSTFEWEAHGLIRNGGGLVATMYLAGSVFAGLMAVHVGSVLAKIT